MKKYFVDFKWQPTRIQIMASYRLSAHKHPADQLGENHVNARVKYGLYSLEYRQQLNQLFRGTQRAKGEADPLRECFDKRYIRRN
jgi:hypothetical protein